MKVINAGNRYEIYEDDLETFNKLPAQFYSVKFSKMVGFYLQKHAPIEIKEKKIYGTHVSKVKKVMDAFPVFERNLGVILSGPKGIGKSLFAKKVAIEAVAANYPVIIVNEYIPGIADFLESIEQEVVVILDEFDKTFKKNKDDVDPQVEMLTLFDGISCGKKLFIITCNNIRGGLNEYIINRPGRCHYHLRFDYPDPNGITEYLHDKLKPEHYKYINDVIYFSKKVDLNYDCLNAIAYELNTGESFKEAIKYLNIINVDLIRYNVNIVMDDGSSDNDVQYIDLFNKEDEVNFGFYIHDVYFTAKFKIKDCKFDINKCMTIVEGDNVHLDFDEDDLEKFKKKGKKFPKPKCITLERKMEKSIHYTV